MFYANFVINGKNYSNVYSGADRWDRFYADTFSPETEMYSLIEFVVHGKTYAERQADLVNTARRWQYENAPGLSYGEMEMVDAWFERMGRRYGLLRDFRENGIC